MTHLYELPPGRYQARVAVTDRTAGRLGSVRHVFDVPHLQGLRLTESPNPVEMIHEIRRADGTVVARTSPTPLAADERGVRTARFEMTLHRFGDYELRLLARDRATGAEASAVERFQVAPAP